MTLPEQPLPATDIARPMPSRRPYAGYSLAQRLVQVLQPGLAVALLVLAFTGWFTLYSIRLHDAQLTHKADLGQIDLAIWNTAHGRFVQEVVGDRTSVRLTDHVEPIFAPLSLIFWVWDDVRALLAAQALALALGALPIYWLARWRLAAALGDWRGASERQPGGNARAGADEPAANGQAEDSAAGRVAAWGGVVFAAAYLLAPPLQAAAVSEFHALALAPPLIAWALWAAERRQWARFVVAAVLLMAVQEGMALLSAALGLYVLARVALGARRHASPTGSRLRRPAWPGLAAGSLVCLGGLAWFYATTFVIIPHFASQAYGLSQTPYAARYGPLGDSFGDIIKSALTRPGLVAGILAEPLRVRYLLGLLALTGFLALLAPEIVLLSLPLLLANLLSTFPFQYSGELHYTAPLVPYFVIAGAFGLARLAGWRAAQAAGRSRTPAGQSRRAARDPGASRDWAGRAGRRIAQFGFGVALAGTLIVQLTAGYTPLGREFWLRAPAPWPPVTAHDRLLSRFAAQIPPAAPLSTTAGLYPHLSHRPLLYQFPTIGRAEWALVDVAGTTDRHPAVIRDQVMSLLAGGWGVVDAADGYLLLAKGRGSPAIPDAFYDFARASTGTAQPAHELDITFGENLKLVGYDVLDEPKWRRTALRLYWQAAGPLPANLAVDVQVVAPDGAHAAGTAQTPMPALTWYAPPRWRPGEIVVTQTPPWYLPAAWAPVVTVKAGDQPWQATGCQGDRAGDTADPYAASLCAPGGSVRLVPLHRTAAGLSLAPAAGGYQTAGARFGSAEWGVRLDSYSLPAGAAPGSNLPVSLVWRGQDGAVPSPAPRDYTVFVHLRDVAGQTVASADATPTLYLPQPTTGWPGGLQAIPDVHTLALPAGISPGRYRVVIGLYDWATGARLPLLDGRGNNSGNEFVLGDVDVDPSRARAADLACLLTPQACASQP